MPRSLVVNADDLGITTGVNDGIFDAHEHGVLTSASLFANAPATSDAIDRARRHPSLGLGVHLALVDGLPILPAGRVPSLVENDGRLRHSWKPFIAACLRGKVSLAEVELELTAQIDRLRSDGLALTHLDAHKHVHAYPPVFAIVARLAARFGIPTVRVPYERWRPIGGDAGSRATRRQQMLFNAALWPWARRDYAVAASLGLRAPSFLGRVDTGILAADSLNAMLRRLRPGVTELMVHPGYHDEDLARTGTRLLDSRRQELDLLCSRDLRSLLASERVDLVTHDVRPVIKRSLRHVS